MTQPIQVERDPAYELNEARQEVDGLKTAVAMYCREMKAAQYQGHLLRRELEKAQEKVAELEKAAQSDEKDSKKGKSKP